MLNLVRCECEHSAHFSSRGPASWELTPHGNPGHSYGVRFAGSYTVTLGTTYGPVTICQDCASDCFAELIRIRIPL